MAAEIIHFPQRHDFCCMNQHRVKGPDSLIACEFCAESLCGYDLSCQCKCERAKTAQPRMIRQVPPTLYPKAPIVLTPASTDTPRRRRDA